MNNLHLAEAATLTAYYEQLRIKLQAMQAAPVKDEAAISQAIDELEAVQLKIKETHGLHGNNPNE